MFFPFAARLLRKGLGYGLAFALSLSVFAVNGSAQQQPATPAATNGATPSTSTAASSQSAVAAGAESGAPRFGIGLQLSSLGLGAQLAARVAPAWNVRVGFNGFGLSRNQTQDGMQYSAHLALRSIQANADWFFWGPLHLSPGLLVYDNNRAYGGLFVPGGNTFTLSNTTYMSASNDPVDGNLNLSANKVAPLLMIGFGNLVPRKGSHFGFSFDIGAAYQGSPQVLLSLRGTVCDQNGLFCQNTSAPSVQADVQAEQTKLEGKLQAFRFYPVVSLGVHYAF